MSTTRVQHEKLSIDKRLFDFVNEQLLPGLDIASATFWQGFAEVVAAHAPTNRAMLDKRNTIQAAIDNWHKANPQADFADYKAMLGEIGYLAPAKSRFSIKTKKVDREIAKVAGAQLVVPVDNPRYALNAANARWNSLYDALYTTDVITQEQGCSSTRKYNPVRGMKVIQYVREFLDTAVPLALGSHSYVVRYFVKGGKLRVEMGDGTITELGQRERFAGYRGDPEKPELVLLKHNHLYIELHIGDGHFIGRGDLANVYDVVMESAISTIMDCEDSVAAVDAEDKVRVYASWLGLMKGDLTRKIERDGEVIQRQLATDREYIAADGSKLTLPGRSLMLVRNVGSHIYSDVVQYDGNDIPETIIDALITAAAACHDLRGKGRFKNSRKGSVYIVKPKMHGPEEVAAAVALFGDVEKVLGLAKNTLKIGIMDEERRTSANLQQCIHAAKHRVVFINTGFLDRTGDEIHTSMHAGPVLPKDAMKGAPWFDAYEDGNVDTGLACGFPGRAQIGKGMWAAPDEMAKMVEQKIAHPRAGANTAWVPSPTAATLHAMHYHQQLVRTRQRELKPHPRSSLDELLSLPLLTHDINHSDMVRELENNAQSILGYVVRWIDAGVGCSKVPDINDVGLMEDRATLRISSQQLANWVLHGITSVEEITGVMKKMAEVVDNQNMGDPNYQPMCDDIQNNHAFQTALDLVLNGVTEPNGYTEPVLIKWRKLRKAAG